MGRPVKLVATRDQGFTIATYRAETRQHVQLAAGNDGRLTALSHEGWECTSRPSGYNVAGVETTARVSGRPVPHEIVARRAGDPVSTYADNALARRALGWDPRFTLEDIISSAWNWHSSHPNGFDA